MNWIADTLGGFIINLFILRKIKRKRAQRGRFCKWYKEGW